MNYSLYVLNLKITVYTVYLLNLIANWIFWKKNLWEINLMLQFFKLNLHFKWHFFPNFAHSEYNLLFIFCRLDSFLPHNSPVRWVLSLFSFVPTEHKLHEILDYRNIHSDFTELKAREIHFMDYIYSNLWIMYVFIT